jgi:hypothetical protein
VTASNSSFERPISDAARNLNATCRRHDLETSTLWFEIMAAFMIDGPMSVEEISYEEDEAVLTEKTRDTQSSL